MPGRIAAAEMMGFSEHWSPAPRPVTQEVSGQPPRDLRARVMAEPASYGRSKAADSSISTVTLGAIVAVLALRARDAQKISLLPLLASKKTEVRRSTQGESYEPEFRESSRCLESCCRWRSAFLPGSEIAAPLRRLLTQRAVCQGVLRRTVKRQVGSPQKSCAETVPKV